MLNNAESRRRSITLPTATHQLTSSTTNPTAICARCNRPLFARRSIARGMGWHCWHKSQEPHLARVAALVFTIGVCQCGRVFDVVAAAEHIDTTAHHLVNDGLALVPRHAAQSGGAR